MGNGGWTIDEMKQQISIPLYSSTIPDSEIENYFHENYNITNWYLDNIETPLSQIVSLYEQ